MYSSATSTRMLCILFLLVIPVVACAQPGAPPDSTLYKNKLTALPFISSSPETSLMFGVFGVQQFKTDKRDTALRSSSVMASVIYTLENQLSLEVYHTVFTPGEKWLLPGKYFYSSFSEKYWERGLSGRRDQEMKAAYSFVSGEVALLRRAGHRFYIGPQVRAIHLWDAALYDPEGRLLPPERNFWVRDYTAAGGGVQAVLDRRNSIFFPTRGFYAQLSAFAYPRFLTTPFSFGSVLLDARAYRELGSDRSVLAGQARCQVSVHQPPFKELALVGGSDIMRGYYKGRYREDNAVQAQAEWRRHLSGRWGLVLFAAGAEVWPRYAFQNQLWSAGAGLRYNTNKRDKNNIRLDYGFGRGTSGIYLTIGEAF